VVYFYFKFQRHAKEVPGTDFSVTDMPAFTTMREIPTSLTTFLSSYESGHRLPLPDALLEVLYQMIQEFPQSFFLLDALDECTDRAELMKILEKRASWRFDNLPTMVTSRKERDIERSLRFLVRERSTICLQSNLADEDIRKYVLHRLFVHKDLEKWQKDPDIVYEIEAALTEGAHGMYV
jgi:hypothetical protein